MSDLLDAASTSSHESFSEKLTMPHKSKAGEEEQTEAEIKQSSWKECEPQSYTV